MRVFGFTDNLGSYEHVQALKQRADAIHGFWSSRRTSTQARPDIRGYSEDYPIADNSTRRPQEEPPRRGLLPADRVAAADAQVVAAPRRCARRGVLGARPPHPHRPPTAPPPTRAPSLREGHCCRGRGRTPTRSNAAGPFTYRLRLDGVGRLPLRRPHPEPEVRSTSWLISRSPCAPPPACLPDRPRTSLLRRHRRPVADCVSRRVSRGSPARSRGVRPGRRGAAR